MAAQAQRQLGDQEIQMYSDLHKDVYGYRPRGLFSVPTSYNEFINQMNIMGARLEEQEIERRAYEAAACRVWKARIRQIAQDNGVDVVTVLRWEMDAEGCYYPDHGYDFEHYLWGQGIGWTRVDRFKKWLRKAVAGN